MRGIGAVKVCIHCKKEKPIVEYEPNKLYLTGYDIKCRACPGWKHPNASASEGM
jgi:hypothetical protein